MNQFRGRLTSDAIHHTFDQYFFSYSFLLELDFTQTRIRFLPYSISQCSFLRRINLCGTLINRPPPVLFSIPQLRAHPENILFGSGQRCTPKMAQQIVSECRYLSASIIQFKDLVKGIDRTISVPAAFSTLDLFASLVPESLSSHPSDFFLIRSFSQKSGAVVNLYVCPEDVPFGIYDVPGAIWSVELKCIPEISYPDLSPFVKAFVARQDQILQQQNAAERNPAQRSAVDRMMSNCGPSADISALRESRFASSLCGTIDINVSDRGLKFQAVTITANRTMLTISMTPTVYYVFPTSVIGIDCDDSDPPVPVLKCGESGLQMRDVAAKLVPLVPILSLLPVESPIVFNGARKVGRFAELMMEATVVFADARDEGILTSPVGTDTPALDKQLTQIQRVKGVVPARRPLDRGDRGPTARTVYRARPAAASFD
jgi:hypothetical protein